MLLLMSMLLIWSALPQPWMLMLSGSLSGRGIATISMPHLAPASSVNSSFECCCLGREENVQRGVHAVCGQHTGQPLHKHILVARRELAQSLQRGLQLGLAELPKLIQKLGM